MNLLCGCLGLVATFLLCQSLVTYYKFVPEDLTVIVNCAIPVMAIFLVILVNEYQRYIRMMEEDEEGDE